jgi:hypothetical protein
VERSVHLDPPRRQRPAHLHGQVVRDDIAPLLELLEEPLGMLDSLFERELLVPFERGLRAADCVLELRLGGVGALHHDGAVDGAAGQEEGRSTYLMVLSVVVLQVMASGSCG